MDYQYKERRYDGVKESRNCRDPFSKEMSAVNLMIYKPKRCRTSRGQETSVVDVQDDNLN